MATNKEETKKVSNKKVETKKTNTNNKEPKKETIKKTIPKKTESKNTSSKKDTPKKTTVKKNEIKESKVKKETNKEIKVVNKTSKKEEKLNRRENYIALVLYSIYIIIGIFTMYFPEIVMIDPLKYVGIVFYILAVCNVITYFLVRKKNHYQRLFTSLINVTIGSICFLSNMKPLEFALGTVILIFSLLLIVNLSYTIYITKEESSQFIKFVIVFLIGFLSLLTIINLYNGLSAAPFMLGYYILSIGIMLIFEPIIYLLVPVSKLEKIFKNVINEKN